MIDQWIVKWQGEPRIQRYLKSCNYDQDLMLATYEWNLRLGLELLRDISHTEIALRNAYDRALTSTWGEQWLTDTNCPIHQPIYRVVTPKGTDRKITNNVNYENPKKIQSAVKKLQHTYEDAPPAGKIIAELPFGVWASFTFQTFHEEFWVPAIHKAYPRGTRRADVHNHIAPIWTVRNRIAHHEPLFFVGRNNPRHPINVHEHVVDLLNLLLPEVALVVRDTSRVRRVYDARPV